MNGSSRIDKPGWYLTRAVLRSDGIVMNVALGPVTEAEGRAAWQQAREAGKHFALMEVKMPGGPVELTLPSPMSVRSLTLTMPDNGTQWETNRDASPIEDIQRLCDIIRSPGREPAEMLVNVRNFRKNSCQVSGVTAEQAAEALALFKGRFPLFADFAGFARFSAHPLAPAVAARLIAAELRLVERVLATRGPRAAERARRLWLFWHRRRP